MSDPTNNNPNDPSEGPSSGSSEPGGWQAPGAGAGAGAGSGTGAGAGSSGPWTAPGSGPAGTGGPGPASGGPQRGRFARITSQLDSMSSTGDRLQLKALTIADILDLTMNILRRQWKVLASVGSVYAVVQAVITLLDAIGGANLSLSTGGSTAFFGSFSAESGNPVVELLTGLAGLVSTFVLLPVAVGATARIVATLFLGQKLTAGDALRGVRKLWPRLLAASLLVMLCQIVGILGLIVGIIVVSVLFSVTIQAIALEECSAADGMKRSAHLTSKRFWPYLGLLVLVFFLRLLVGIILWLIPTVLAALFDGIGLDPIAWIIMGASTLVSSLVTVAISGIVGALIYIDARVRFEAFDVQVMSGGVGAAPDPAGPVPQPPVDDASTSGPREDQGPADPGASDPPPFR